MEGDLLGLFSTPAFLGSGAPSLGLDLWGLGRAGEGCSDAMLLTENVRGMDCADVDEADIEEVDDTGCPILATGLCKSSELSMRAGGRGGCGRREETRGEESVGRLLIPLVIILLVLILLLEPFLDGGLLGLILLLGERSLSIEA